MLILGNGRVITRDVKKSVSGKRAVAIEGTTIKKVGSFDEVRAAYPDAEFIDAKGN